MNARVSEMNLSRTISGTVAIAMAAVLLSILAALVAAPLHASAQGTGTVPMTVTVPMTSTIPMTGTLPVTTTTPATTPVAATPAAKAQGPTSCFEAMVNSQPQEVIFDSSTYTVTVDAGTSVCVDSAFDLMIGFFGQAPFAVNGEGASKLPAPEVDYLYGQGPIAGTLTYDLTASEDVDLVLTDVNGTNGSVLVWLGSLKSTSAAPAKPAAAASSTALMLLKAGDKVTTRWTNGNEPVWGPFTQVAGNLSLEVTASVAFTMTSAVGYADVPAQVCGDNCWKAVVPTDGSWEGDELQGLYWTDLLVGTTDARVLMPAPVQSTTASASGKVQYKNAAGAYFATANCTGTPVIRDPAATAYPCGGGRGRIAGAPASRLPYLPLILR